MTIALDSASTLVWNMAVSFFQTFCKKPLHLCTQVQCTLERSMLEICIYCLFWKKGNGDGVFFPACNRCSSSVKPNSNGSLHGPQRIKIQLFLCDSSFAPPNIFWLWEHSHAWNGAKSFKMISTSTCHCLPVFTNAWHGAARWHWLSNDSYKLKCFVNFIWKRTNRSSVPRLDVKSQQRRYTSHVEQFSGFSGGSYYQALSA